MAKGILVSVQALEGAAVAGALIFKDQVQTALFNEDKFVLCFSDEIISEMQVQGVLSGDYLISTQAEVMFGPQLCSLG